MVVYGLFTIGGCIFIAAAKLSGVDLRVSISVPIALMLGYLAVSIAVGRLRLHDEQTGDNLYYMGFLFTLSSLGVALFQFTSSGSTDEVVRNFGVAVTSTIMGIALRIFYNQTRRDPIDIERSARHELADMTRRVRVELESASREFADFRRVSNQMLEEGFGEIVTQAQRNGEHVRETFEKMAAAAIKPVQDVSARLSNAMAENFTRVEEQFSEIAKKVEAASALLESANSTMAGSVSRLGGQADTVASKLERVVVPDEVLKTELAPMVKLLGNAVAQYAIKTETAAQEQQARMSAIIDAVQRVAEKSENSAIAAQKVAEVAGDQRRLTETFLSFVQSQSKQMNELVEKLVATQSLLASAQAQPIATEALAPDFASAGPANGGEFEPIALPPRPDDEAVPVKRGWFR
ncbi:MAG: hypothetical protein EOS76_11830 [Mesorhizobium sp.]|uniref:hypothetical protein n=1 Tax=Mesorhizobium sp. TaxID=1871066 RepID=UPI000FD59317|nr:hypothetical protein [Mesorhizobium sp.]RVC81505.1 hypothetical protein EN766_03115 [Mesorhizobium sp. M2A.F.Ca.ET.046.02.1.1]RWE19483.1 MAG: hypothetical protein EOS76_11830 [Mesorhizobium sp.]